MADEKSIKFDVTGSIPSDLRQRNDDWLRDEDVRESERAIHRLLGRGGEMSEKAVDPSVIEQMVNQYGRIDPDRLLVTDEFVGWIAPDGTIIELPEGVDWMASAAELREAFGVTEQEMAAEEFFALMLRAGFATVGFSLTSLFLASVFFSDPPRQVLAEIGNLLNMRPDVNVEVRIPDEQVVARSIQEFERVTDFTVLDFQEDLSQYETALQNEVRRVWRGEVGREQFEADLLANVELGLERAWTTALAECGLSRQEATEQERDILRAEIIEASNAYDGFFDFLAQNRQGDVEWESGVLQRRLRVWANRYQAVYNATKASACGDKKFKWVRNPAKDSCTDCIHLDGRVHRASVWYAHDVYPQHRGLECGGWECGCKFEETEEPALPGFPPKITGA